MAYAVVTVLMVGQNKNQKKPTKTGEAAVKYDLKMNQEKNKYMEGKTKAQEREIKILRGNKEVY